MKRTKNWSIYPNTNNIAHPFTPLTKNLPLLIYYCGHEYRKIDFFQKLQDSDMKYICYTVSGESYVKYRDIEYIVPEGYLYVIDCQELNYYCSKSDTWETIWIHFGGFASDFFCELINGDSFNLVNCRNNPNILYTLNTLLELSEHYGYKHDINIMNMMTNLFTSLYEIQYESPSDNIPYHLRKPIKESIRLFNENYSEKIIIDELLHDMNITPSNFYKYFKNYTGKTPYDYLMDIRLSRAKFYLKYTDLAISDISDKVGFNNVNNFIRAFSKEYKITPKQYRLNISEL